MVLAIYGKGGLGHEIYELAYRINEAGSRFDEILFVDDNASANLDEETGARVMTCAEAMEAFPAGELFFAIGVGEPDIRHALYKKVTGAGYAAATLIHPGVTIPNGSRVEGAIICQYVFISCNAAVGPNTLVNPCSSIGHNNIIGESCVIASGCQLAGNVSVGERTFVGMCSAVKQGVKIGSDTIIGMNTAVNKDVPDGMLAYGVPVEYRKREEGQTVFAVYSKS